MADATLNVDINASGAFESLRRLGGAMRGLGNDLDYADKHLKKFEGSIKGSFRGAMNSLRASIGTIGFGIFVRELVNVNTAFERVRIAMFAGANTAQEAAADFDYLMKASSRLGVPVRSVGLEFAKMTAAVKGTTLEGQGIRSIFEKISKGMVAVGLDASHMQLAFQAITQMINKGVINMEELRQQFGEKMPGAIRAAMEAMGYGRDRIKEFSDDVKKGKITPEDFLPKFADVIEKQFGRAFEEAIKGPQIAINQFKNAFDRLLYSLGQQGFMNEFIGLLRDLTAIMHGDKAAGAVRSLGEALEFLMHQVRVFVVFAAKNFVPIFAALSGGAVSGAILKMGSFAAAISASFKAIQAQTGAGLVRSVLMMVRPWHLVAVGVGLATAALLAFQGKLVTINGYTARLGDWVAAGFDALRDSVLGTSGPLAQFINNNKVLHGLFTATQGALARFNDVFAQTNDMSKAGTAAWAQFTGVFKTIVGEDTFNAFAQFFNSLQTLFAGVGSLVMGIGKTILDVIVQVGPQILNVATVIVGAIGSVIGSVAHSIGVIVSALGTAWSAVAGVITGETPTIINSLGAAITQIATLVAGVLTLAGQALEGVANVIAGALTGLFGTLGPIMQDTMSFFDTVTPKAREFARAPGRGESWLNLGNIIRDLKDDLTELMDGLTAISFVIGELAGIVVGNLGAAFGMVWQIISDGIDTAVGAFREIGVALGLVSDDATNTGETVTREVGGSAIKAADFFEEFGNVAVGVGAIVVGSVNLIVQEFIAVIDVINQAIERAYELGQAIHEIGAGIATLNFDRITGGFDGIKNAFRELDFSKITGAKDNFENQVERGFTAGTRARQRVEEIQQGRGAQVGTLTRAPAPKGADLTGFSSGGSSSDLFNSISRDAQLRTRAADKAKADYQKAAAAEALARDQAVQAREARVANLRESEATRIAAEKAAGGGSSGGGSIASKQKLINEILGGNAHFTSGHRSLAENKRVGGVPNSMHLTGQAVDFLPPKGMSMKDAADLLKMSGKFSEVLNEGDHVHAGWRGGKGKGGTKKTQAEKEADKISDTSMDLNTELASKTRLTAALQKEAMSREEIAKLMAADQALKQSGIGMTNEQAQAIGGEAKQIADLAMLTEEANQEFEKYAKISGDIVDLRRDNGGLSREIELLRTQGGTLNDLTKVMNVEGELRRNKIDMTYKEAVASGGLVGQLAEELMAHENLLQTLEQERHIREGLDKMRDEQAQIAMIAPAAALGGFDFASAKADVEAATYVMGNLGLAAFKGRDALSAQEQKLYDWVKVVSLARDTGLDLSGGLDKITQDYYETIAPINELNTRQIELNNSTLQYIRLLVEQNPTAAWAQGLAQLLPMYDAIIQRQNALTSNNPFERMHQWAVDNAREMDDWASQLTTVAENVNQKLTSSLTDFIMTGKFEWQDFVKFVIQQLAQMVAQWISAQITMAATNALKGMFGGGGGGFLGFGGASLSGIAGLFAGGGVMTGDGPVKLYARGGVANSPQAAIFGEGTMPEAYVPLPDGRTIPVTLSGNFGTGQGVDYAALANAITTGMNQALLMQSTRVDPSRFDRAMASDEPAATAPGTLTINTEVHIHNEAGQTQAAGQGGAESQRQLGEMLTRQVSEVVRSEVVKTIREELRPGGSFNRFGRGTSGGVF